MDHLQTWKVNIENTLNLADAPIEDLILMDELAHDLFKYVEPEYQETTGSNDILSQIRNTSKTAGGGSFRNFMVSNQARKEVAAKPLLGDFFKNHSMQNRYNRRNGNG